MGLARIFRKTGRDVVAGGATASSLLCASVLLGCGMAAAPQPPSLHLPRPVKDLTATRAGNQIQLRWTSPKETTDRVKLVGAVKFKICRQQGTAHCQTIAKTTAPPGKPASYVDVLIDPLASGPLRDVKYEISGINQHGRTAGPSNAASALIGDAPPPVTKLTAHMIESGVVLHWQPVSALPANTSVQIERVLLVPKPTGKNKSAIPGPAEPLNQTLSVTLKPGGGANSSTSTPKPTQPGTPLSNPKSGLVSQDPGAALDTTAQFDRTYRYIVSRIVTVKSGNLVLRAASTPSAPVTIFTRDVFPPAVPSGLVAIPVSATLNGGMPEVDLSWAANTEQDFAGYRVYRREEGSAGGPAVGPETRIAPENSAEPLAAPAFQDRHVTPRHTYAYSVSAVDADGNESARSPEVKVTVPQS